MIGIFDSGIGGSTVFREIFKSLPNQDYIYYADSKHNPYGEKSRKEIFKIVKNVVDCLIAKGCLIIVIACNTASAVCVNKLRETYPHIIFIAIEPAYKMVYDYGFKDKTLVLATKGTIESKKFLNLFRRYDNHQTTLFSCDGLANLIEKNDIDKIDEYLKINLDKFKGVKNVVLGCTHYPLVKENIKKILGNVTFFDGSIGITHELERKLISSNLINNGTGEITFICSSDEEKEKRFYDIIKSYQTN